MKKYTLFAFVAMFMLVGCDALSPRTLLQGATVVSEVPQARQDIIDYLPADKLATVQTDLDYLDDLYTRAVELIPTSDNDPEIPVIGDGSAISALTALLGVPEKVIRVEQAYANVRQAVSDHKTSSRIDPPPALVAFDYNAQKSYKTVRDAVEANDRLVRAIEVLKLLRPFAVLLV